MSLTGEILKRLGIEDMNQTERAIVGVNLINHLYDGSITRREWGQITCDLANRFFLNYEFVDIAIGVPAFVNKGILDDDISEELAWQLSASVAQDKVHLDEICFRLLKSKSSVDLDVEDIVALLHQEDVARVIQANVPKNYLRLESDFGAFPDRILVRVNRDFVAEKGLVVTTPYRFEEGQEFYVHLGDYGIYNWKEGDRVVSMGRYSRGIIELSKYLDILEAVYSYKN